MTVDLIRSLDARGGEARGSDAPGGAGEFPGVFESSLEAASRGSSGKFETADSGGRESSKKIEVRSDRADRKQAKPSGDDDDAKRAEAAAESGAVGADATRVEERAPVESTAERRSDDRLEQAARGEGLEEGEALDEEESRELVSRLEAAGLGAADGDEASADADAAATGAAASGVPQATAGAADASREAASELAEASREAAEAERAAELAAAERESDSDRSDTREQYAERPTDEALYERAAEGSSQAGVDPNLRQAVASAEEAQRAPEVVAVDGAPAVASPVAGQVSETTTTATPGSPQPVVASDAISVQTEWLATRGGGTARLVLHPPELGEIAIRVSLRGGAVDVVMVAQEAVAQGVAEEQSERLSQAFANRDLRLENFEVRRGSAEDLPNGDAGRFAESESRRDGRGNDEDGGGRRGVGGGDGADEAPLAVPRILTRAPETGVDLRI